MNRLVTLVVGLGMAAWAIAVLFAQGEKSAFWWSAGQVVVFYYLATIPHELGHVLAARACGCKVLHVQLGSGPLLVDASFLGIRWRLHLLLGGHSYSRDVIGTVRLFRTKSWLATAGGPGANLLLVTLAIAWLGSPSWTVLVPEQGTATLQAFAVANLAQVVVSLWPHRIEGEDGSYPSDGLQLLELPRLSDQEVHELVDDAME